MSSIDYKQPSDELAADYQLPGETENNDDTVPTTPQNLIVLSFLRDLGKNATLREALSKACILITKAQLTDVNSIYLLLKESIKIAQIGNRQVSEILEIINFNLFREYLNGHGTASLSGLINVSDKHINRNDLILIHTNLVSIKAAYIENLQKEKKHIPQVVAEQSDVDETARIFALLQRYINEKCDDYLEGITHYTRYHITNVEDLIAAYPSICVFLGAELLLPEIPGQFIEMLRQNHGIVSRFLQSSAPSYYSGRINQLQEFFDMIMGILDKEA